MISREVSPDPAVTKDFVGLVSVRASLVELGLFQLQLQATLSLQRDIPQTFPAAPTGLLDHRCHRG